MSQSPLYTPRLASPSASTTSLLPPTPGASNRGSGSNSPYDAASARRPSSIQSSVSDKFSLSPDPKEWGAAVGLNVREPDDYLHNPDPKRDRKNDQGGTFLTARGFMNLGCLLLLAVSLIALFAGYPLFSFFTKHTISFKGGFNIGGINSTGQVPNMPGNYGMIDLETPQDAYTYSSFRDNSKWQLVWSDEFNTEGRSFWPVDLHYWQTNNLEWYSPDAITTKGGALQVTLAKKKNHGLNYEGGMMSTWNKFCFTGGLVLTSVNLPGANNVVGLWDDGESRPYSYDACDVGTAPNQTHNGLPLAATENGDPGNNDALSYLPGQRLSRCTCPGESHPGPMHSDGTYVGRAAPEIDIFEAQVANDVGYVSQSCQWAPFNHEYVWLNTSDNLIIYDDTVTELNSYLGGAFQQATSGVSKTAQACYQLDSSCFATYGIEYKPGFDDAYITWVNNGKHAWTINVGGLGADNAVEISARPIPQEPLYLIINLGVSENFGTVDFDHLKFPAIMTVDWVRVYQDPDNINLGCDPKDFPTAAYINEYLEAYQNPNLTTWKDDYKQPNPKSSFLGQC